MPRFRFARAHALSAIAGAAVLAMFLVSYSPLAFGRALAADSELASYSAAMPNGAIATVTAPSGDVEHGIPLEIAASVQWPEGAPAASRGSFRANSYLANEEVRAELELEGAAGKIDLGSLSLDWPPGHHLADIRISIDGESVTIRKVPIKIAHASSAGRYEHINPATIVAVDANYAAGKWRFHLADGSRRAISMTEQERLAGEYAVNFSLRYKHVARGWVPLGAQ